jgi:hypothetical protein
MRQGLKLISESAKPVPVEPKRKTHLFENQTRKGGAPEKKAKSKSLQDVRLRHPPGITLSIGNKNL